MVIGRLTRQRATPNLCVFCTFRDTTIRQPRRDVHSTSNNYRPLEATATKEDRREESSNQSQWDVRRARSPASVSQESQRKLQWDSIFSTLPGRNKPSSNPTIAPRQDAQRSEGRPHSLGVSGEPRSNWFAQQKEQQRDGQGGKDRPKWDHLRSNGASLSWKSPEHTSREQPIPVDRRQQEQNDRERRYSQGQFVSFRDGQASQRSLFRQSPDVGQDGNAMAGQSGQTQAEGGFQPLKSNLRVVNTSSPPLTSRGGSERGASERGWFNERRREAARPMTWTENRAGNREHQTPVGPYPRIRTVGVEKQPRSATDEAGSVESIDAAVGDIGVAETLFDEPVGTPLRHKKTETALSRREQYMEMLVEPEERSKKKRATRVPRGDSVEEDDKDWDKINLKRERKRQRQAEKKVRASGPQLLLPDFISVGNLATALKIRAEAFVPKLADLGFEDLTNDYVIDAETAGLIASEFGFTPVLPSKTSDEDLVAAPPPDEGSLLLPRPPVITIMGHVDHGKTTLLDWLRKSSVAASEYGGITQHIGAFMVQMPSGRIVTFLDTPGHEAFLDMRARGANVTDIVILVVAADDSVKPQTIEAIKHAKAANVPIIVAITKVDKEDANPERVKQDLARQGIEVEDFGGDTQTVCISGKTGQGMEDLEDAAIALADVLDVKADTTGEVEGWVLEASRKRSGKVATVLVRRGTLSTGNILVAGKTWTRVRTLRNEAGVLVQSATPGTPVEVDGWREQPEAGSEFLQAPDEQRARRVVDIRIERGESEKVAADVLAVNEARRAEEEKRRREEAIENGEEVEEKVKVPGLKTIPFILRADVSGSVEALQASILALGNSEIRPSVLRAAVGSLSENDIEHAATAKGHVINFNSQIDGEIVRLAGRERVKIIDGNVIYRVVNEVKAVLEDNLPPNVISRVTGEADIAQVFDIKVKGKQTMPVAGCKVRNGTVAKGSKVKVLRDREVIYDGILNSLKNQKKDVTEMRKGTECGLGFENFVGFQAGDQVQCYETHEEKRTL